MLTKRVELAPSCDKGINVSLFKSNYFKRAFNLVHILEFLNNNCNEYVKEDEESKKFEEYPIEISDWPFIKSTVMHYIVPTFTC